MTELDPDPGLLDEPDIVHWSPRRGRLIGAGQSYGEPAAAAIAAFALGAFAVGALAIGALAIGRLAVGQARIKDLRIGKLVVDELMVRRRTA